MKKLRHFSHAFAHLLLTAWITPGRGAGLPCSTRSTRGPQLGVEEIMMKTLHATEAHSLELFLASETHVLSIEEEEYRLVSIVGTFGDLKSTLAAQPRYRDPDLAFALAALLRSGLGYPNQGSAPFFSPLFAIDVGHDLAWTGWGSIEGQRGPGSMSSRLTSHAYTFAVESLALDPALTVGADSGSAARAARRLHIVS
jgi:hypothetical protein